VLFLIFFLIALGLIGIAMWLGWRDVALDGSLSRRGLFTVCGLVIASIVVFIFGMGWREIGPGQVGVRVLTGRVQPGTVPPGLFWMIPGFESVVIYDGRVLSYTFDGIEGATKDLQPVVMTGQINYHIDPGSADEILQEVGGPDDYAVKVFLTPADTALKEVTPLYNAQEIISKRDEIGRLTLTSLTERMAPFHIVIDRVSVANVGLDPEFMQSVEAKQIAQQDLARADFEAQTAQRLAEGEAQAAIARAEGDAQGIILRADAQADANRALDLSLTPDVLAWQSISRLSDKIRVLMVPSDQGLIFDVGDIVSEQP
jgi:regulator of protease activity HflC (stomatin/prohibitin superfamily)